MNATEAKAGWLHGVVDRSNARLQRFFAGKREQARNTSPQALKLVSAVADFTMRGGKRLRPAALHAAYCAIKHGGDVERTLDAAAALEVLQSYFLIQDDWMDNDEERRGGPAVHVALAREYDDAQLGAKLAILASDVASGFAWELIASASFPPARMQEALAAFGRMHFEVVCGQQLDLLEHEDVALVHQLKTGSYTVRGPLLLGALLGDANAEQIQALDRFGTPLGLAFQLRDDLLGAFGQSAVSGKPVGRDIRAGKRTALVSEAQACLNATDRQLFDWVLGNPEATDEALARATAALLESGVRERLETRIGQLLSEAQAALTGAPLEADGVAMLCDLASKLALRDR